MAAASLNLAKAQQLLRELCNGRCVSPPQTPTWLTALLSHALRITLAVGSLLTTEGSTISSLSYALCLDFVITLTQTCHQQPSHIVPVLLHPDVSFMRKGNRTWLRRGLELDFVI